MNPELQTYRRVMDRAREVAVLILGDVHEGAAPGTVTCSEGVIWAVQYLTGADKPISLTFPMECLMAADPVQCYRDWVYHAKVDKIILDRQRQTAKARYRALDKLQTKAWLDTVEWTAEDLKYPKNPGWGEDWADHRAKMSRYKQADRELQEYLNSPAVKKARDDIRNSVPGGL